MPGRPSEPFDQRLDRLISRGRDVVEGVSGTRPGRRADNREASRPADRRPGWRSELDGLGRWVEGRLDWLLEDEGDWQEPWQESPSRPSRPIAERQPSGPATTSSQPEERPARTNRRSLDAISRRSGPSTPGQPRTPAERDADPGVAESTRQSAAAAAQPSSSPLDDWPDDDAFQLPRWSRPTIKPATAGPAESTRSSTPSSVDPDRRAVDPEGRSTLPARPLPRSSRRRVL